MRDQAKARERRRRYLDRRKAEKYGQDAIGRDMRGRHGNHARGAANGRWNHSGRFVTSHGYIAIRVAANHPRAFGPAHGRQRYAYEHDLIAERMLGRHLRDYECVHHLDGDRQNNDPTNLIVETRSDHAREHGNAPGARDSQGRFAPSARRLRDRKGANPAEWPEDLRVREWPRTERHVT